MKLSLDIRIVRDTEGKRAIRVWPEIEGTTNAVTGLVVFAVVLLTAASLYAIAATPDPELKPTITIVGGY